MTSTTLHDGVPLRLLGTRQLNAHLAVCCQVHWWSTMQVSHEPRTAGRQLALGGVGSREVKIFNVDHPLSESTIENRTSPIAWVRFRCQGQGEQDPEFGQKTSLQSSTSGRGPASTLGSQHHDNEPCHATSAGWIDSIEITASNTTPRSPAWPACQPAGQPTRSTYPVRNEGRSTACQTCHA